MRKRAYILVLVIGGGIVGGATGVEKPTTEPDSCVTEECHTDYAGEEHVHGPVEEGECDACHEAAEVAEHTFELAAEEPELCEQCHDEREKQYQHSALEDGECSQCHEAHGSGNEYLLPTATVNEACLECHEHDEDTPNLHAPETMADCRGCHESHESDYQFMLAKEAGELCLSCHNATSEQGKMFNLHPLGVPVGRMSEGGELPLFARADSEAGSVLTCQTCHTLHEPAHANCLRVSSDDLCVVCHESAKSIRSSMHSRDILGEEGDSFCRPCHRVHAVEEGAAGMWAAPLGGKGKRVGEKRCLGCHEESDSVRKPLFFEHPEPRMVAGAIQLWLSGRTEGRWLGEVAPITCVTCHLPHGLVVEGDGAGELDVAGARAGKVMVRQGVAQDLCAMCHGFDAAGMFLYYHWPNKRW